MRSHRTLFLLAGITVLTAALLGQSLVPTSDVCPPEQYSKEKPCVIAPHEEYESYASGFQQILRSVQFTSLRLNATDLKK
jgi:hypothetical protein